MDEITFRIMDTLSRELGNLLSINELTKKIGQSYGTAYYANTYRKLRNLLAHGNITIQRAGKSSLICLDFANYLLTDLLTEMELIRNRDLLEKNPALLMLLVDIDRHFKDSSVIRSMSLVNPERNLRLNRIELLPILQNLPEDTSMRDWLLETHGMLQALQRKHNMRIDSLALDKDEFLTLLGSGETNPLKEMLSNKIAFFHPQTFWRDIRDAFEKGIQVRTRAGETNPAKITEEDLIFNLARFGYKEMGPQIRQAEKICIEYIVTSILLKNEARRMNAIPIILAKNEVSYNLLIFLSRKFGASGKLLGLLRALSRIKPMKEVQLAIEILELLGTREVKADERTIREKMALYDAA